MGFLDYPGLQRFKAKLDALFATKIDATQKGVANGVAGLDSSGKVPSTQLPSYVDDVIEVATYNDLPLTGESGKIYVTTDTGNTYRWSGSAYVQIGIADVFDGATATTAGTQGLVPGPAAGNQSSFLRGDGTWNTPTNTKNTAGSTDTSDKLFIVGAKSQAASPQTYSHDTAYVGTDGCLYSDGKKVLTDHQDISGKKNVQSAISSPSASGNALAFIDTISQNAQGVITPTKKNIPTMGAATSSAAGTAGLVPAPAAGDNEKYLKGDGTWAEVQASGGTLRVVPFSIGANSWTLANGLYTATYSSTYVTATSVEFVEYTDSFRQAVRGDLSWAKATGNGGITFTTDVQPVGTLQGEIRIIDNDDGAVAIITQQTALPTIRDVPFTIAVADWSLNADNLYEAVFQSSFISATSHDFVEFDESIENATDSIKVGKAESSGAVIGLKFTSRRMPVGIVSGTVTPLDSADGKIAVAIQDTIMPVENGGTGSNTLKGAQDTLGITALDDSLPVNRWHINRWLRFDPENKKGLIIKAGTTLMRANGSPKYFATDTAIDLTANLGQAGKDYGVYLLNDGTITAALLTSAPTNSVKIGRFHTLCANVGTITNMQIAMSPSCGYAVGDNVLVKPYRQDEDPDFYAFYNKTITAVTVQSKYDVVACHHPLSGFEAGDILPESVFCLSWFPDTLYEDAMAYDKETDIPIDIYLQSGTGLNTRSAYNATHTVYREEINHTRDLMTVGKRPLTDHEFTSAALGSNERTNITGSSDKTYVGGHVDTSGRRMISAIGIEEMCGYLWQWLDEIGDVGGADWKTYDSHASFGQSYGTIPYCLLGGGYWADSSYCGSRSRTAADPRSLVNTARGGRGASRMCYGKRST